MSPPITVPDPRDICAAVLKAGDEIDMLKLGRIEQDLRCGRPITTEEQRARQWLAENDGGYCISSAARQYADYREQLTRTQGGTIVTTRTRNGHTTTRVRRFPPVKSASQAPRRGAARLARPRERRAGASSSTAGTDPGDSDGSDPEPPARGAAHRVALSWLDGGAEFLAVEDAAR